MKPGKFKEITEEMIGNGDTACSCSSHVGEVIIAANKRKKTSFREIADSLEKKDKNQQAKKPGKER